MHLGFFLVGGMGFFFGFFVLLGTNTLPVFRVGLINIEDRATVCEKGSETSSLWNV